jgi:hypothetical protein
MNTNTYSLLEKKIINCFETLKNKNEMIIFENEKYLIEEVGKPYPQNGGGECKTDVYICLVNNMGKKELKISIKDEKSAYMGSYISEETASKIFGNEWRNIIKDATKSLKEEFLSTPLVYTKGKLKNSITIGWRLDIEPIKKSKRKLSYPIEMIEQNIKDSFYKGVYLELEKRDAKVNGNVIINSGIAEYILVTKIDKIKRAEDVIASMVKINDSIIPKSRFAFKALNYKIDKKKSSNGARPLAVWINWEVENEKLKPEINFTKPLHFKGKEAVNKLNTYFKQKNINELNEKNVNKIIKKQ